jgi:hypothetical protein
LPGRDGGMYDGAPLRSGDISAWAHGEDDACRLRQTLRQAGRDRGPAKAPRCCTRPASCWSRSGLGCSTGCAATWPNSASSISFAPWVSRSSGYRRASSHRTARAMSVGGWPPSPASGRSQEVNVKRCWGQLFNISRHVYIISSPHHSPGPQKVVTVCHIGCMQRRSQQEKLRSACAGCRRGRSSSVDV